jgi:inhibitor of KinA sporulation pathway (predicted exonuclease)
MRYVIVDLEATCWENGTSPDRMEIIEIGAVLLASSTGPVTSEFASFVKPVASPLLSEFCTRLTSIRQEDVDRAEPFWAVFPRFVSWIGNEPFRLCSWGAYDLNQLRKDCARHKLTLPASFENHINLKKEFSSLYAVRPTGMKGALAIAGLPLTGTHHRGIDDARNIAALAQVILPQMHAEWES